MPWILLLWPLGALSRVARGLAWVEYRLPSSRLRALADRLGYLVDLWAIRGLCAAVQRWGNRAPRWAPRFARDACRSIRA